MIKFRLIKIKYKDFIKDLLECRKLEKLRKDYDKKRKETEIKKQAVKVIEM